MNTGDILHDLRIGTKSSFDYIFSKYYRPLIAYIDRVIKSPMDAEDIAVDTLTSLWTSRQSATFRSEKDIESFLFKGAKNRCLNYLRDQSVRKKHHATIGSSQQINTLDDRLHTPERQEIYDILIKSIMTEIERLPQECAQVIRLCYIYGMRISQIATYMGIPIKTVKSRKLYGLQMLRKRLNCDQLYRDFKKS